MTRLALATPDRVLIDGDVRFHHIGKATWVLGSSYSLAGYEKDKATFMAANPTLRADRLMWGLARWRWPLAPNRRLAGLWWLAAHLPGVRVRAHLSRWLERREPVLGARR